MLNTHGLKNMAHRYKPKVYLEVEGGTLGEVMDWFVSNNCPYDVRDIDYPNKIIESVQDTVNSQAREIEELLRRTDQLEVELGVQTDKALVLAEEVEELLSPSSRRPPPHFKLPDERPSIVHEFYIGDTPLGHGCVIVGLYPNTEEIGEIFIKMAVKTPDPGDDVRVLKQQIRELTWFLRGILDKLAIAVSVGLQRGIPFEVYSTKFVHTQFPPDGYTRNKDIPRCTSIIDYLFRWMSFRFLGNRGE